jgi:hypothetical protein
MRTLDIHISEATLSRAEARVQAWREARQKWEPTRENAEVAAHYVKRRVREILIRRAKAVRHVG